MSLIPVTIITGFLGAGKTTLLNRILRDKQHKQRIAVIENEFGEENIDSNILVQDDAEQIVEMSNGCICCTIRSDLVSPDTSGKQTQKRRNQLRPCCYRNDWPGRSGAGCPDFLSGRCRCRRLHDRRNHHADGCRIRHAPA